MTMHPNDPPAKRARRTMLCLLAAGALVVSTAGAERAAHAQEFRPEPLPRERLPRPIDLGCDGITIVEWRASRFIGRISGPTPAGIQTMKKLCRVALDRYPTYLAYRNYRYEVKRVTVAIAMMPANILLDGAEPRNLNDLARRFVTSTSPCCFWGLTVSSDPIAVYLRNDPVKRIRGAIVEHPQFARSFLHEMGHALNKLYRVRELNFPGQPAVDERVCEDWVTWAGYLFKSETSEDDAEAKEAEGATRPSTPSPLASE